MPRNPYDDGADRFFTEYEGSPFEQAHAECAFESWRCITARRGWPRLITARSSHTHFSDFAGRPRASCAYLHVEHMKRGGAMSRMIQIRNVPEDLHRALKARAALEGRSLSDLILEELRALATRPSALELERRLAARAPADLHESSAALVREERDAR